MSHRSTTDRPTDRIAPMLASPRSRFHAALGLFALWVGFLVTLAATSAQTPRRDAQAPAAKPAPAPAPAAAKPGS
jgi:hypothetical protein